MMKALYEVVSKAGANMSETSRNAVLGLIDDDSSEKTGESMLYVAIASGIADILEDAMAITHARLVGAFVKNLPAATAGPLIKYVSFLPFDMDGY